MVRVLYAFRGYILTNAWSELRVRYAGTALGILWNVIHPITIVAVLSVVFSELLPGRVGINGETDITLYLATGLLPWVVFTDCVVRGTQALADNAVFLKKLPIPEEVFVAKTALGSMFYLLIVLMLLFALCGLSGRLHVAAWPGMVAVGVLFILMGFGFSLALSALNVFLRDVAQIVPVLLQIGMWLLPILYPIELAPPVLRSAMAWMPFYPFLLAGRELLLHGAAPSALAWLWMLAWTVGAIAFGSAVLARLRAGLRDAL